MTTIFHEITEALVREGFQDLAAKKAQQGKSLDFKITPYSLNTKLSFKFDNLAHFVEFLRLHGIENLDEKTAALQTTLNELALGPNEFFYVNFFEHGKETEM
ncbi:hypothetical protein [Flavobacterium caeni]|uniref:Uncharacterized protein n=1 Tax=Flavobacterium caeni TaxID=490189 RepID=A0A1G5E3X1_9FLAO|nr:hypothetical protein [Flavobacterium caeni]SCY21649.1 hypothetical protein SAMN02927903_00932 [Flavobacterium caeni]